MIQCEEGFIGPTFVLMGTGGLKVGGWGTGQGGSAKQNLALLGLGRQKRFTKTKVKGHSEREPTSSGVVGPSDTCPQGSEPTTRGRVGGCRVWLKR